MNNQIINLTVVPKSLRARSNIMTAKEAALFDEMINGWSIRRTGALRYTQSSVDAGISVVKNMLNYIGDPPWYWTEDDFDAWCNHIGVERKLARNTQRNYQSAIRTFFEYIVGNTKFKNEVHRDYGIELKQLCTRENCMPHVNEDEKTKRRPAFTHEQIVEFFDAMTVGINESAKFHSKDYRPLQRDKVLFYVLYIGGLRISEALGLNEHSFEPNPEIPEFGQYGFINVWGKGSKGSGKKHRRVPVTHPMLPELLHWYVKDIYPIFLVNADANETALFLSERGRRLGRSSAEERFQHALALADMEGMGFTPHSMRHSSVTHEMQRLTPEAVKIKTGHASITTTEHYNHLSDATVLKEVNDMVRNELDQIVGQPTEGENK